MNKLNHFLLIPLTTFFIFLIFLFAFFELPRAYNVDAELLLFLFLVLPAGIAFFAAHLILISQIEWFFIRQIEISAEKTFHISLIINLISIIRILCRCGKRGLSFN